MIIKEPIKVICVDSKSNKLIKGATYNANNLWVHLNDKYVYLKDIGTYNAKYFNTLDGTPLIKHSDFSMEVRKDVDPKSKNYTGQFVKCRYSSGKNYKEGEIYYVEKQISIEKKSSGYYNSSTYTEYKFKIRGIKISSSTHRFEEIPIIEQRKIKLKNLKGEKIKTGEQTRKFLLYSEKEKISILFEILSKVLIDINKTDNIEKLNFDIVDLMIKKDLKYSLTREDIEPFLRENLNTHLNVFLE